jgi:molecular chaperone GrpE (heat shock protein)
MFAFLIDWLEQLVTSLKEKNVEKFEAWIARSTDDDFRQMVWRGSLNRVLVAEECGFAKKSLQTNPVISAGLKKLEDDLRERGVLPSLDNQKESSIPPSESFRHIKESEKASRTNQRMNQLEQENASLRATLAELRDRLKRYELFDEILHDSGRLPR